MTLRQAQGDRDVLIRREGAVGHISLNRPKALHALTREMCEAISAALLEWRDDDGIEAVILDHAEGRGFCAGGDVAMVRRSVLEDGGADGRAFFHAEYRMNHLLFTYPKSTVCVMDGIVMGGGAGLALPCTFRVATENTLLAMPETAIGLFPDVGGGWYLSRLGLPLGRFIALTGARLDGAECLWASLATHYLPHKQLEEAKARIAAHPDRIGEILTGLSVEPPPARLEGNLANINHFFSSEHLEDILATLEHDNSPWAAKELATLRTKSPQACKVALNQLEISPGYDDFADWMSIEYRVASRVIMLPDFAEGVRAVLVDKDNAPRWNPASPKLGIDEMIEAIYEPLPPGEEWTPYPA